MWSRAYDDADCVADQPSDQHRAQQQSEGPGERCVDELVHRRRIHRERRPEIAGHKDAIEEAAVLLDQRAAQPEGVGQGCAQRLDLCLLHVLALGLDLAEHRLDRIGGQEARQEEDERDPEQDHAHVADETGR